MNCGDEEIWGIRVHLMLAVTTVFYLPLYHGQSMTTTARLTISFPPYPPPLLSIAGISRCVSGPNTNGSQFFLTLDKTDWYDTPPCPPSFSAKQRALPLFLTSH